MHISKLKYFVIIIIISVFILIGCTGSVSPTNILPSVIPTNTYVNDPEPSITAQNDENPIIFSEVLAGVQGNNNYEFIELYNRSLEPVDLLGWSIWYRLPSSQEDIFIFRWQHPAIVPPLGHYLLSQHGQDIGIAADGEFEQSINTFHGGLQLRQMDGEVRDTIGWGSSVEGFFETTPASSMSNGLSLERIPGGSLGNNNDTGNNSLDFIANSSPSPQNSGSAITPADVDALTISINSPETTPPGKEFKSSITIKNTCKLNAHDITVSLPIPEGLTVVSLSQGVTQENDVLTWKIDNLPVDEEESTQITFRTPWTYYITRAINYFASAENCPFPAYGGPVSTRIEGGVIPIQNARGLAGADLTIEGIVTMPTGAMFAGSGNTKFYLQDKTGGIQVYVVDGQGKIGLKIGSHVTVRGNVQVYRGSLEIVPILVPDDVVLIGAQNNPTAPLAVTIDDTLTDQVSLSGSLINVNGTVNRVEEFPYSYEIDLVDDMGEMLTLYVDKQADINVERVEIGQLYNVTGILDIKDTRLYLYPRIQEDLQQIYPPELMLEVNAPALLPDSNLITYTLDINNHTTGQLSNIVVLAGVPDFTTISSIEDGGTMEYSQVLWKIPELPGNGSHLSVHFTVRVNKPSPESIILDDSNVTAQELTGSISGNPVQTFSGKYIPIWAIQGDGFRSAYVFQNITTIGVVTGIYPSLGGFFIQEMEMDDNLSTSEGLFISTGVKELPIIVGDEIEVSGIIREISNQTSLQLTDLANIYIQDQGNSLPPPVELDPPSSPDKAENYYEALEGMLVQVTGPAVAVAPTSKYGEYVVVLPYHNVNRLFQGNENGYAIMIDDGMSIVHNDNSGLAYTISTGDIVSNLIGPLAYTYGRYKMEPVTAPMIDKVELVPEPIHPTQQGEFSIMTWNVENLFDYLDPNPADPPRPSFLQYHNSLTKIANTIQLAGYPSIISLQEVENIRVLQDLSNHDLLKKFGYQPVLMEGTDSRGIDVGYLVRSDVAEVRNVVQRNSPDEIFSRPPLVIQLELSINGEKFLLYLINNHFASMSSGVDSTEQLRISQAAWNASLVNEILENDPNALVAVVGDLNSFYGSSPLQTLIDVGLSNVLDLVAAEDRYTYIFEGQSQVLDHILVTPHLEKKIKRVEMLRTNSDYPPQAPGDISAIRKSDHDPIIVTFSP